MYGKVSSPKLLKALNIRARERESGFKVKSKTKR